MSRAQEIEKFLNENEFSLVGNVIEDPDVENGFTVFLRVSRDNDGGQRPTNFAISKAERQILAKEETITFVLINKLTEELNVNVKSMLMRKFPEEIKNVFTSINDNNAHVWIEPKKIMTPQETVVIRGELEGFLPYLNMKLGDFINISEMALPSPTFFLRIIRKFSPISTDEIGKKIQEYNFEYPSTDWLEKNLDRLRKKQLVARKKNGQYILTLIGLKMLGSSKDRRSPDIGRALDMAKRRR